MIVKEKIIYLDDCRVALKIFIDDVNKFSVLDDETEDSNLSRSFNDCYKITKLMKMAYDAGKNGEEIIFITEETENSDDDD